MATIIADAGAQDVRARPTRSVGVVTTLMPALVFFTIAFPKGGVRILDVPITIAYLMTPAMALFAMLRARSLKLPKDRLLAFCPAALLAAWSAVVVNTNGTDDIGYTLSYFISATYLPLFGLIFYSDLVMSDRSESVEKALLWAMRFVVVYGLLLFVYKLATGRWIEVPYLTVNADDVGNLGNKFIDRGGIFKLISTYNNGNIFGVTMSIIAPLYLRMERRRVLVALFYGAMLLTLSRTVWIGAVLVLVLHALSNRIRPLTLIYLAVGLLLTALAVYYLLLFIGRDLDFIFDRTLGNRASQLNVFFDPRVIPDRITTVLPEIVYTGVLGNFGYPGLFLFVLHLVMPPFLLLAEGVRLLSRSRASACLQGLLIYPILAASDSGYNFTPVMMVFWTISGLGFWYARAEGWTTRRAHAPAR